jgi:hypothetical protein
MAGKSFTIGKITAAGKGLGSWLFMAPEGSAGALGKGTIAVKLEGTRQAAELTSLVGKSVTVGKAPVTAAGAGHWLVLHPNAGLAAKGIAGAAGGGAAGKGLAGSEMVMMKLEGAKQAAQLPMLAGKSFTVATPPMAGKEAINWLFLKPTGGAGLAGKDMVALKVQHGAAQLPTLVGKTVTVGKSPLVAGNAGKWLVLQTGAGMSTKAAAATTVAAKSVYMAKGVTVAGTVSKGAATAKTAVAGKTLATATATAAKAAAGGTIWTGTGFSLGLGLGLGAFGPVLLGAAAAAAGYGFLSPPPGPGNHRHGTRGGRCRGNFLESRAGAGVCQNHPPGHQGGAGRYLNPSNHEMLRGVYS